MKTYFTRERQRRSNKKSERGIKRFIGSRWYDESGLKSVLKSRSSLNLYYLFCILLNMRAGGYAGASQVASYNFFFDRVRINLRQVSTADATGTE